MKGTQDHPPTPPLMSCDPSFGLSDFPRGHTEGGGGGDLHKTPNLQYPPLQFDPATPPPLVQPMDCLVGAIVTTKTTLSRAVVWIGFLFGGFSNCCLKKRDCLWSIMLLLRTPRGGGRARTHPPTQGPGSQWIGGSGWTHPSPPRGGG